MAYARIGKEDGSLALVLHNANKINANQYRAIADRAGQMTDKELVLAMIVGDVVAFRFDTNMVGLLVVLSYLPGEADVSFASYTPSLVEWAAGSGIIAFGLFAFSLGVKYLRVVDHRLMSEEHETVNVKSHEIVSI